MNMRRFASIAVTLLIAVNLFGQVDPEPPCSASLTWEPAPTGILIHLSGTVPGSQYAPDGVHLVLFAKFPNQQPVAVGGLTCDSPATSCTSDELFDGCVIAPHYSMAVAPCGTTNGVQFIDPVIDRQPTIAKFDAGSLLAKIDVSFPHQGHSGILPRVRLNWAPSNDLASSGFGADSPTVDADGNLVQTYDLQDPAPVGTVGVFATAFSCDATLVDFAYSPLPGKESGCDGSSAANCNGCEKGCVGDPIQTSNGNVRYTETDPMPSNPAFRLVRFYDSESPSSGLFGTHWTSPFDGRAYTINLGSGSLSDSHRAVFLTTERNQQVAFERRTSSQPYRQIWPRNQTAQGRLSYDGTSYVYQADGEGIVRTYNATTGLITGYRAVAADQGVTIAWQSGFPTTVTDNRGNWTLTVTNDGTVITGVGVTGQPSLQWSYVHAGGQLTNVEDAASNVWRTYDYDGNSLLTQVSDARGAVIESHQYDAAGKGITSSGPSGEVTNVVYNPSDRTPRTADETITSVTYGSNYRADYYMRPIAGRLRVVTINGPCTSCDMNDVVDTYDEKGNVVREQDGRGYITTFTYDQSGSTLASTSGPWRPAACDPAIDAQQCRLTPDDLAAVPLATTTATKTTGYDYVNPSWPSRATHVASTSVLQPTAFKVTGMTYDALSGEVLVRSVSGFTGQDAHFETRTTTVSLYDGTETASFSPGGNFDPAWETKPQPRVSRKSVDGPRTDLTDVTEYVYYPIDPAVPAVLRGRLAAVRNAAGNTTRMENYDVFGHATRVVDPNGVATETTYDALGRLLTSTLKGVSGCDTVVDPLCATDLTTINTYSPPTGPSATSVRPSGAVTVYGYDARGRLASLARGPSTSTLAEKIEYDYDPVNDLKSQERYVDVAGGNAITRRESYGYDSSNRLSAITHDDSTAVAYTYDGSGHLLTVKDERNSTPNTTNAYDAAGRLSKVTQVLSTAPGGSIATQYGYDIDGNLTSVTDPNGNVTSYVYDDFGQLIGQVSPVTGTTTYSYDVAGNAISTTDANQATTARTYDALNRVTSAVSSRTGLLTETLTYTYDAGDFGIGRLSTMDGTSYSYERRGLLTAVADDDGPTITFAYNANGDRTSLIYPSGRVVETTFDFAGRPVTASSDGTAVVSSASYLPFGPMTSMVYGNGTTKTMLYDGRYRPQENRLTTASAVIADYLYQEDAVGNITQIHDAVSAAYNRDFAYDDLNRLTTANSGSSLWGNGSYEYDAMGNMTSLHIGNRSLSFTYDGSTPRLQSVTGTNPATVEYDSAGNEQLIGAYSARNLLQRVGAVSFTLPRLEFSYDGRGVRILATRTGGNVGTAASRRWIYSPELHLLAQSGWVAGLILGGISGGTEYIWFGDQPIAQVFLDPALPMRFSFTDHIGTPLLQTDASATVVWRAEYEPYGRVYAYRVGDETDPQAIRLPGQEADDAAVGQEYNIFRWYRSEWGRYSQADPVGVRAGLNLFRYAGANPTRFRDPFGLIAWKCDFGFIGGGELVGGGILKATCNSPCAGGKLRHVVLEGVIGGITFGLPVGINIASDVIMEDGSDSVVATNLVGLGTYHSATVSFVAGCGQSDFKLGKAKGSSGCSWWAGFGASFDNFAGDMEIKADVPECCK